jgi:hypothetical protein
MTGVNIINAIKVGRFPKAEQIKPCADYTDKQIDCPL